MRRFNWPLILKSMVIVAVAYCTAYGVHSFQVRHAAKYFLVHADIQEQQNDPRKEADYLYRYIQMQPADAAIRLRLARTFYRTATTVDQFQRASEFYASALGLNSERIELHRELAEIRLRLGDPIGAAERARKGLAIEPLDSGCRKTLAIALYEQARNSDRLKTQDVAQAFENALQARPGDISLALTAAKFYRVNLRDEVLSRRAERADAVMDRLVGAAPKDPNLLLARYGYRRSYGLKGADLDLDAALAASPENSDVQYAAGDRELSRQDYLAAEKCFQIVVKTAPLDHRGYLGLGKALMSQGRREEAIEVLNRGVLLAGKADLTFRSEWATVLISLNRMPEAEQLIDNIERTVDALVPLLNVAERSETLNAVRLLRCQWLFASDKFTTAIPLLKSGLAATSGSATVSIEQQLRGYAMLGASYGRLGQWDLAAEAYKLAARKQPISSRWKILQGESLERSGQCKSAISAYEEAIRMSDAPPTIQTSLARCKMQAVLQEPETERRWSEIESKLVEIQSAQRDNVGVALLQAQFAASQGRTQDAVAVLRRAEKDFGDSPEVWAATAIAYESLGVIADADRAWMHYREKSGPTLEEVTLRCEQLCRRKQYDAARTYIAERMALMTGDTLRQTRIAAALLERRAGRKQEALVQLTEAAVESGNDLRAWELVGESALEQEDFERVRAAEEALAKNEGADGCVWRELQCRRLLIDSAARNPDTLSRVAVLQEEIQARRPQWPRGYLVKGLLAEVKGYIKPAIAAYEEAIQLGDHRDEVYRRLIPLLLSENRLADANRNIARLASSEVIDDRTVLLSISANIRGGDGTRAVEIARAAVERDPKNVTPRIWLGQALLVSRQTAAAEKELELATTLAPSDIRTWLSLFSVHLQSKNFAKATEVLLELARQPSLPAEQREFVLAQGYELLGDEAKAKKHYLEARKLAPDDAAIQHTCGMFFLRHSPDLAEGSLRRTLDLTPTSSSARRALASILAAKGNERAWQEAWSLMTKDRGQENRSAPDRRLMALLLTFRGSPENRREALSLLESLVKSGEQPTSGDRMLLAKLYEQFGKTTEASRELLLLTSKEDCDTAYLAIFADFLLRQKKAGDAAPVVRRLEQRVPDSFAAAALRARLFHDKGQVDEVRPLIDGYVARKTLQSGEVTNRTQVILEAANLYAFLKMPQDAERQYRHLFSVAPHEYRHLVKFLVLSGRTSEAVQLCLQAAESHDSAGATSLLCSSLARGEASREDHQRAESVIVRALQKHEKDTTLLFSAATLRFFQHRNEEALELFLKVLKIDPEHVSALNNVANLLSETPNRAGEAVEYAKRAIAIQGPHSDLLDTLGMTLLRKGDSREAIEAFSQACAHPTADPRYYFHLALANKTVGDLKAAREALLKAQSLNLGEQILTDEEKSELASLENRLSDNGKMRL